MGSAPPAEVAAQALLDPPAGPPVAPDDCYLDSEVHRSQQPITIPPPLTVYIGGHGTGSEPRTALLVPWGSRNSLATPAPGTPQGQTKNLSPSVKKRTKKKNKKMVLAHAPPVLSVTSTRGCQTLQEQSNEVNTTSTGTSTSEATLGNNISPRSEVPSSPSALPQDPGQLADVLQLPDEVPLRDALRFFDCFMEDVEVIKDKTRSSPVPEEHRGTGQAIPPCAFSSLSLPEEVPLEDALRFFGCFTEDVEVIKDKTRSSPVTEEHRGTGLAIAPCAFSSLSLPEEVPLEDALRFFDCFTEDVEVIKDETRSSPGPEEHRGAGAAIPPCPSSSPLLPEDLLSPDYSVPKTADAILSLNEFVMSLGPQDPWEEAEMDIEPPQCSVFERRGQKRGKSPLPSPPSKRRALGESQEVEGWD
ncbi:proline-rich protein 22 [Cuculus canorus]|uniref:proline-rich protein 22 n=1 Tax=Cuculus canorus TaxID=55661 RepID=UPI0023AA541C|nr:proline-rich protein 22 [Cuculus canorus]